MTHAMKQRRIAKIRKWQKENPDKVKAAAHRYYLKNKKRYIKKSKAWAKAHPKRRREISRNWERRRREKVKLNIYAKIK